MTVSMRVMSAGDGFRYLLRTVAAGDGERSLSTPLTRYYSAKGTPPGRWMGSGLPGLSTGEIEQGDEVTEEQLQLLIGSGRDPVSGVPLGRAYPVYRRESQPVAGRGDPAKGPSGSASSGEVLPRPNVEEVHHRRRAVAGYDFTFSIPKSASVLWGIADAHTQRCIANAHHEAVAAALVYIEREVAATRTGWHAGDGAVAQVEVAGLIATAFDHFDSRAGDPHLHTHVVFSNKVQTSRDGKWRSLDGRPMHAAVVALSELHEALFADALTRALGVQWERRERGRDRHPAWAVKSVPEALIAEFSTRSRHIDVETDRLIDAYVSAYRHRPNPATVMRLRAQATLSTRPPKEVRSLSDLMAEWRNRAAVALGSDVTNWARIASTCRSPLVLRSDEISQVTISALGRSVMTAVSEKRATWRHWNLTAEAARQTMHYRFASASDREAVVGRVVHAAESASIRITPPEFASSPPAFRRHDGTSVFRPRHSTTYTSAELLDAEARLLERGADESGPKLAPAALRSAAPVQLPSGGLLGEDQLAALEMIARSGRILDLLVGPAGAGKTTTMNTLRHAWETANGAGSVVGLAPSAAAAHVLAGDLGIRTENLSKWWQNHLTQGESFRPSQLVIIDEASLASTLLLDRITARAAAVGAKVLLVGDHAQLQSIDAGGAFAMLVHHHPDPPELVDLHRFVHDWERSATRELRVGNTEAVDLYMNHGRIRDGSSEAMADAAFEAWRADARAGKTTVLISDSNEAVTALNQRARNALILEGRIDARREVAIHDGARAAAGDAVITRRNNRLLQAGRTWVRNGDCWVVIATRRNGSLEVRRQGHQWGSAVLLPADYVKRHVELGYAVTSHRAQGVTTDTAHVVVAPGMTRENLYVAMSRGREANHAYVAVDRPDAAHVGPRPGDTPVSASSVLHGVLKHVGAELSAHETIAAEQDAWGSVAQLAAEYETIAATAQHGRWVSLVSHSGLTDQQAEAVIDSDAFGPLAGELRRAEAYGFDLQRLIRGVVASRGFDGAHDIAAVLGARVATVVVQHGSNGARAGQKGHLVAGLIPKAVGFMDAEMHRALVEREHLIEARATAILDAAIQSKEAWATALGASPRGSARAAWRSRACTLAAYRDRYGIISATPLGPTPQSTAQALDAARARTALNEARSIARTQAAEEQSARTQSGHPLAAIQL